MLPGVFILQVAVEVLLAANNQPVFLVKVLILNDLQI